MKRVIAFQSVSEKKLAETINELYAATDCELNVEYMTANKLDSTGRIVPLFIAFVSFDVTEYGNIPKVN